MGRSFQKMKFHFSSTATPGYAHLYPKIALVIAFHLAIKLQNAIELVVKKWCFATSNNNVYDFEI